VLSHYLKSADRSLENRSKRLAALSERVARQLRLSEREIDDIRVAALLQDMEHIEVTARVIRRAVGDLRRSDSEEEEHTFHGSDLVQSLGSVLTGALPLILNLTESRDLEFSDDAMRTSSTAPFGVTIIGTLREYDALIHGHGVNAMEPGEALRTLRADLDESHHPAVLHALEQVLIQSGQAGAGLLEPTPSWLRPPPTSTKRNSTFVTLRLGSDVVAVWHCLESDVVANPQDHPRFQAVFVGQTPSVAALALLDVVSHPARWRTFPPRPAVPHNRCISKFCADRRKNRLVLAPNGIRRS